MVAGCLGKCLQVRAITQEEKRIDEGIWRCVLEYTHSHILEVAMEHESEKVQPFKFEDVRRGVRVATVYDGNGDELSCRCLECGEVGWKCGTD